MKNYIEKENYFTLTDDNDYHWIYNGNRVYCVEGEKEFIELGLDPINDKNGYGAWSIDEAIEILLWGGYIQEDPRK